MEVDGAVYFDAPYRFYQGRSTLETDVRIVKDDERGNSSDSEDEGSELRPGPSPHANSKGPRTEYAKIISASNDIPGLKSEVLGYSTASSSSWENQTMDMRTSFTPVDQSLLSALVRRYPQGELFVFDDEGPVSPHHNAPKPTRLYSAEKLAQRKARKRVEIMRLLDSFPNARQIFFVPLYDSTSGCFIGSFAWSTSATRIFSLENHHSYLIAFGHSVMSEVSRLNTLSADRAKGDFISNVSHELRSPLHGILASVEFLAESTLDGFQRNLVDTVEYVILQTHEQTTAVFCAIYLDTREPCSAVSRRLPTVANSLTVVFVGARCWIPLNTFWISPRSRNSAKNPRSRWEE